MGFLEIDTEMVRQNFAPKETAIGRDVLWGIPRNRLLLMNFMVLGLNRQDWLTFAYAGCQSVRIM